jgi:putative transposase
MKFVNSQFSFLKALPAAMTAAELEIPVTPADAGHGQGYQMEVGDRFTVYSPGRHVEGHFKVAGWLQAADGQPRRVDLENVLSGSHLYLDMWQVSTLEAQRRIRPVSLAGGDSHEHGRTPGLALAMDERRLSKAEAVLGYVHACMDVFALENGGRTSRRLAEKAIREHAAARGEKAPSYSNIWEKYKAFVETPQHDDPLLLLAEKRRPGNPGSRFGSLVDDILETAVKAAWEKRNGTWRTARSVFNSILEHKRASGEVPRNDDPDLKLPSSRTIQRRMQQVNEYDRLRWRHGEAYANRKMAFYVRQHLPEHPLDIVDIDHVTLDIVVIDDRYPLAFGRPDLVVVRDRATGSILGYSLSFANPSFASVLQALRHAMFPKDMSAFPGLSWKAYGRPLRLGVDNAMHFIGDDITNAAQQLGFQIVEYRPGHPWEKGALERLNGIINQQAVLGLPGATASNPGERMKFGQEAAMAEPVLKLSELEGFLVHYFCDIYHRRPQAGLGILRSLKGVPDVL